MAPKAPKVGSDTLVGALSNDAPKRRRLNRRSTGERVDRAIAEHFSGASAAQTDILKHQGLTLREKVTEDLRRATALFVPLDLWAKGRES